MLEKKFNELDDDFITVWSGVILTKELNSLTFKENYYPALMALANLGQINALQSVMLFNDILKYVDEQELAATVKKYHYINPGKRDLNKDLVIYNHATKDDIHKTSLFSMLISLQKGEIDQRSYNSRLFKNLIVGHKKEKDPLVKERYHEICNGCDMKNYDYTAVGSLLLRKKLKQLMQNNNSPANRFAYAKNLYFFGSKKQRELGYYMLKDLANRELSETTKKEMELTTKHINETDDKIFAQGIERELKQYEYGCVPR